MFSSAPRNVFSAILTASSGQSLGNARVGDRFNEKINICGPAPAQCGHGVEQSFFVQRDRVADRAEQFEARNSGLPEVAPVARTNAAIP